MSTQRPEVDPDRNYSREERICLAMAHYHADLNAHNQDPKTSKKPIVSQLAKLYDVPETTLRRHIRNPCQRTRKEVHEEQQVVSVVEEKVLAERLLFLDGLNEPVDKALVYELAHLLCRRRHPDITLGRDWIYRFLERHPECRPVISSTRRKTDTRHLNSHSACTLEREAVPAETKGKADDQKEDVKLKKQSRGHEGVRKAQEKEKVVEGKRKVEEREREKLRKVEEKEREKIRKAEEWQRRAEERQKLMEERKAERQRKVAEGRS